MSSMLHVLNVCPQCCVLNVAVLNAVCPHCPIGVAASKFYFESIKVDKTLMVLWQRPVGEEGEAIATIATEAPEAPQALILGSPHPLHCNGKIVQCSK